MQLSLAFISAYTVAMMRLNVSSDILMLNDTKLLCFVPELRVSPQIGVQL